MHKLEMNDYKKAVTEGWCLNVGSSVADRHQILMVHVGSTPTQQRLPLHWCLLFLFSLLLFQCTECSPNHFVLFNFFGVHSFSRYIDCCTAPVNDRRKVKKMFFSDSQSWILTCCFQCYELPVGEIEQGRFECTNEPVIPQTCVSGRSCAGFTSR